MTTRQSTVAICVKISDADNKPVLRYCGTKQTMILVEALAKAREIREWVEKKQK